MLWIHLFCPSCSHAPFHGEVPLDKTHSIWGERHGFFLKKCWHQVLDESENWNDNPRIVLQMTAVQFHLKVLLKNSFWKICSIFFLSFIITKSFGFWRPLTYSHCYSRSLDFRVDCLVKSHRLIHNLCKNPQRRKDGAQTYLVIVLFDSDKRNLIFCFCV